LRAFCLIVLLAVLCLRVATYATADRVAPRYLGAWTLTGAADLPWAKHPANPAARKGLIGRAVVFRAETIDGPAPFACRTPRYAVREVAAAEILGSAFGKLPARDAEPLAAALGFSGARVRTLATGCNVDIHFVDAATARVVRGDTVYTLTRH
jgi:hypothetical protein